MATNNVTPMRWNYFGIDDDPGLRENVLLQFSDGAVALGRHCFNKNAVAWQRTTVRDYQMEHLQVILRGLPELRMVACIKRDPLIMNELRTGLEHYRESELAAFVELVRTLDKKAHYDGVPCINHNKQ